MSIQTLSANPTVDGKLAFSWQVMAVPVAISIQIALDSEFTVDARTFVVPKEVKSCLLDTGTGQWFYRVGAWLGTSSEGVVDWSGIYGPVTIQSLRDKVPLSEFPLMIYAVKPALNSVVFHTGLYETYYIIIHVTQASVFKASKLKTYYKQDHGSATIHATDLDSSATYNFQLQTLVGDKSHLPTDTIQLLTDVYAIYNKRTGMPVQGRSGTDRATYAADRAMLQDSVGRPNQRFFSYAQYLQFQAAKARTSASQE